MIEADDDGRLRDAVEATRLGFGLTSGEVEALVRSAIDLRVVGICIPSSFLAEASALLRSSGGHRPELVTVANFPIGDHSDSRVLADVREAARAGADHIDIVVPGRHVREGKWAAVTALVRAARTEAEDAGGREVRIKVILETAALSVAEIRGAGAAAVEGGAAWLKTSTGFHSAGGATAEAVRLLRSIAPPGVGVKASGGIRTRADALTMLGAGADRIGTSAERSILA